MSKSILASGAVSAPPTHTQATARPWIACFSTLDRVHVGFHIAGKPYGSTRPICEARLSDQYAPEMAANAALIVKAVNRDHHFDELVKALGDAIHMLETAAARFNMMGGVGLVNGANPKIGYSEIMDELPSIRAALAGAK